MLTTSVIRSWIARYVLNVRGFITLGLYLSYFSYGLGYSILGPTWLDLKSFLGATDQEMGYSKMFQAAGYCFGCLFGGFVFKYLNRSLAMVGALILMGVCTILMAVVPSFPIFCTLMFVIMLGAGPIDLGCNTWGLELFQNNGAVNLQIIHLFFTFGQMAAAVLAKPFVSRDDVDDDPASQNHSRRLNDSLRETHTIDYTFNPLDVANASTNATTNPDEWQVSRIEIAYAICGAVNIAAAIYMITVWIYLRVTERQRKAEQLVNDDKPAGHITNMENRSRSSSLSACTNVHAAHGTNSGSESSALIKNYAHTKFTKVWTIFWSSLMLGFECGLEVIAFAYMFNYLSYSGIQKGRALDINSYFNLTYNICRVICICITFFIPVKTSLIFCLMLASSSMFGLYFAEGNDSAVLAFSCLLGAGFSCNYPSMYSFINDRVKMTPPVGGVIMFVSGLVMGLDPLVIGSYIGSNPDIFLYTIGVNMIIVLCSMTILEISLCRFKKSGIMKRL